MANHPFDFDPDTGERIKPAGPDTAAPGLIECPDCAREVSRRASTCIHCGAPLAAQSDPTPPDQTQTIEQTGKEFKAMQAFAFVAIVGAVIVHAAVSAELALALYLLGGVLALVGGLGSWWHHG